MPKSKPEPREWSPTAVSNALMILNESRYWKTLASKEDIEMARAKNKHEKHVLACHNLFHISYVHESMKETREYVSHLGGIAKKRKKIKAEKKAKKKERNLPTQSPSPPVPPQRQKIEGFVLSKDILDDIAEGALEIPKDARQDQLRIIREYITHRVGFDPNKILLGVSSHMAH